MREDSVAHKNKISLIVLMFLLISVLIVCDEKSTEPQDTIPPATINTLHLIKFDNNSVTLGWNAPGDDGLTGRASKYDLRFSIDSLTEVNWSNANIVSGLLSPSNPGSNEVKTITGLTDDPVYCFGIKTMDKADNWSGLSNIVLIECDDIIPPSPIIDLYIFHSDNESVTVGWSSSGDDSNSGTASYYDIRYDTEIINNQNWSSTNQFENEPSPQIAGTQELFQISKLPKDTTFFIALKVVDGSGNWSELSNVISIRINSIDNISPSRITDLSLLNITTNAVTLSWTSPGDDSTNGYASYYDIRYNTDSITDINWEQSEIVHNTIVPQQSGMEENIQVNDLSELTTYYFGIRSTDESGNTSEISKILKITTFGAGAISWITTYGGNEIDLANSVIVDSYGNIVIAGKTNSFGAGGYDVYVIKTDQDGNLIWENTFGGAEEDYGVDIVEADDGGYTIAGVTNSFGDNPSNVILINTDFNGYVDWTKIHGTSYSIYGLYGFDKRYNGGYLLSGMYARSTGYYIMTDINGNIQHINTFIGSNCTDQSRTYYGQGRGFEIENLSNNYFIHSYYIYSWDMWGHTGCGMPTEYTNINVYNAYGTRIWGANIGIACGDIVIEETSDNGILIRTSCWSYGSALRKFDLEGNLIWEKSWDYSIIDIVSGTGVNYFLSEYGNGFVIHKVNNNGEILENIIYENDDFPIEPKKIAIAKDENLIITGYQDSENDSTQVVLIKINRNF